MSASAGAGAARACAACLSRTWLIARLAGSIEIARHHKRRLREILALSEEQLLAGLGGVRVTAIAEEFERLDVDALREAVEESGLDAVCRHDAAYPARLRDLEDAPAVLFVAGGAGRLEGLVGADLEQGPRAVAVVGTRRASADGLEVARALGRGLAAAGVTVVSGMALGVDSAAHAGALESSGRTVAVLAGGADVPYPPSKARLHRMIAERACVVGELPPGFVAMRWCFPARNRVIAALAHMTIVVEAARRSGSLITAEIAMDIGREVGAVPGPVTAWRSAGTNALLRDGATVIRDAADALDVAVGIGRHEAAVLHLEPRLRALLGAVADGRDTLAALARVPAEVGPTLAALTELELLGHLRRSAGGRYVVIPT
jgi:DNA processing protein